MSRSYYHVTDPATGRHHIYAHAATPTEASAHACRMSPEPLDRCWADFNGQTEGCSRPTWRQGLCRIHHDEIVGRGVAA